MTEEQAAQIGDALARIATAVENIGRHIEAQRSPAPTATASRPVEAARVEARAVPPRRRPTSA
jgi:hypothetical protein